MTERGEKIKKEKGEGRKNQEMTSSKRSENTKRDTTKPYTRNKMSWQ
jgi:hypothetical protein